MKQQSNINLLGLLTILFSITFMIWISNSNYSLANSFAHVSNINNDQQKSVPKAPKRTLPSEVKSAVLAAASQQTSKTVTSLRILESKAQEWSDGCLGIAEPGEICLQRVISGWQIKVTDGLRIWTFRTDESGDLIRLEPSTN